MKNSRLLTQGVLNDEALEALSNLAASRNEPFAQQVAAAGLDPGSDLRFADLSDVDLSYSDLRGFDLTGADLRGSVGIHVKWDDTTRLEGAEIGGSIFSLRYRLARFFSPNEIAREILRKVSIKDAGDKIIWAADNLRDQETREVAINVTQALFYSTTDGFLRSQLLDFLSPRISGESDLRDLLVASLSIADKTIVVRAALALFERYGMAHDRTARRATLALLRSESLGIRGAALEFLIRTYATGPERDQIRSIALEEGGYLSRLFVAGCARQISAKHDAVARNPITGDTFEIDERIPVSLVRQMARRTLLNSELAGRRRSAPRNKSGLDYAESALEDAMMEVRALLGEMNRVFASFEIVSDQVQ